MPEPAAGVIHDIGYQRYQGPRLGRGYAVRSLFTHSLRTAYGLGRSPKAKIFPWLVVGIVGTVAVVAIAVRAATGQVAVSYLALPDAVFPLLILFGAIIGPELFSRDLHSGVLPLYFSRPLRRSDYVLAKLAGLLSALWLLLAAPQFAVFLGAVFAVNGWSEVWDELGDFAQGLANAAIHAAVVGALALLISSLLRRRAVAAPLVVAAFLVTLPVVGLLQALGSEAVQQIAGLFSPGTLVLGVRAWLFGEPELPDYGGFEPLYGAVALGLVAACVGLALLRYRRVSA